MEGASRYVMDLAFQPPNRTRQDPTATPTCVYLICCPCLAAIPDAIPAALCTSAALPFLDSFGRKRT